MSAQYRPYRDDDNGTDSEPMTWADQEPGSVQIYEKTTEDIRVVSHRNLVIGGVGIALLGLLAGLLAGYFAHTQHSGCVRGKSVAIHAVFDADPTIRDRLLQMVDHSLIGVRLHRTLLSPDAQTDDQLVELLHTTWSRHGLESVERDSYNVLLSFPDAARPNRLEIRDGATREMVSSFDLFGAEHKPYVAYAPAGSVEGPVVYASHLGHREVDALHELNVTLEGSVLLARLGLYPPAYQIGLAQLVGAKALLLYPDPAEFHPTLAQNTVTSSPCASFSASAASGSQTLCVPPDPRRRLGGVPVEKSMPGSFPGLDYRVGGGSHVADLQVHNRLQNHTVHNLVGYIRGKVEPDRYVLVGSARDSWGQSELGGTAVLLELTAVFGQLLKEGWRPRRSILFCSWGAGEFNSVGSTEWLEEHMKLLHSRAVAYVDLETPVMGASALSVSASPLLYHAVFNATKQVSSRNRRVPEGARTVYDQWARVFPMRRNVSHLLFPPSVEPGEEDVFEEEDELPPFLLDPVPRELLASYVHAAMLPTRPAVLPMEMNGGYAAFFTRAGIPVVHMSYLDDVMRKVSLPPYGRTRSLMVLETLVLLTLGLSLGAQVHARVAQVAGELVRDLADSLFLPFNLLDYAQLLRDLYFSLHIHMGSLGHGLDLSILDSAVQNFSAAAFAFHLRQSNLDTSDPMAIRRVNDQLLLLERAFLDPVGLPQNPYKKHIVLSPAESPAYVDEMFPGITDEFMRFLDQLGAPEDLRPHAATLHKHYHLLVQTLEQAADSLAEVVPPQATPSHATPTSATPTS
ncbi:unnamed protein product [Ixodes persulcatus]